MRPEPFGKSVFDKLEALTVVWLETVRLLLFGGFIAILARLFW